MERTESEISLHKRLMHAAISRKGVVLNEAEYQKFEIACWRAIDDNKLLNFDGLLIAANIYLNFILEFPELTL